MVGVQTEELGAKFDEPNVAAFFSPFMPTKLFSFDFATFFLCLLVVLK